MPSTFKSRTFAASLVFTLMATAGCSAIAPVEVEPIQSRTEALFGQVQFDLEIEDIVLLNPYLAEESPRSDAFDAASNDLFLVAELLVSYSTDLIDLVRRESDKEAIPEFLQLLGNFYDKLEAIPGVRRHLAAVDLDAIRREAIEQRNLTLAFRVAAPVQDSAADAIRDLVVEAEDLLQEAFDEIFGKISNEFDPFIAYWGNLTVRHNQVLEELLLLDSARDGAADAWRPLLASDEPLRSQLGEDAALTQVTIDEAEAILVARLANLVEIWGYLQPAYTNYQTVLRELYAVQSNANHALQIASIVIDSWDKAQRELAAGQRAPFVAATQDLLGIAIRSNVR